MNKCDKVLKQLNSTEQGKQFYVLLAWLQNLSLGAYVYSSLTGRELKWQTQIECMCPLIWTHLRGLIYFLQESRKLTPL